MSNRQKPTLMSREPDDLKLIIAFLAVVFLVFIAIGQIVHDLK